MAKPIGYFDRTPTIRTVAQMNARLAERTGTVMEQRGDLPCQVPTAADSPPTAAPTVLAWNDPVKNPDGSGHQTSIGGMWSVARVRTNGEWRYEAWKRLPLPYMLAIRSSAPEARNECQKASEQ